MKLNINEYESFFIELEAESTEEAALLVRMGMNATQKIRVTAFASDKSINAQISIGNSKKRSGLIPKK